MSEKLVQSISEKVEEKLNTQSITTSSQNSGPSTVGSRRLHHVDELKPRIMVIGVGGAGGNAVNNMIRSHLEGVEFVVMNTDAQALSQSLTDRRIQLGVKITQGLGAGSVPDIGRAATEESLEAVENEIEGCNMVFIACGEGGGTGTGSAPVVAKAAREKGILTVGVITKPFHFEGAHRMKAADNGIEELQKYVDTLIIIPNQNLFRVANENTTFSDAFKMADDVLYAGVRGITDLMIMPGLINLDFADVRSVMSEMGKAMMGTGEAEGEGRAIAAAEAAIANPLLDDISMRGAKGVLISVTGGLDMTLFEVDEAANRIRDEIESEANIIFGSTFDESLNGKIRVAVVATGIDAVKVQANKPSFQSSNNIKSPNKPYPGTVKPEQINESPAMDAGIKFEDDLHSEEVDLDIEDSISQPINLEEKISRSQTQKYDKSHTGKKRGFFSRLFFGEDQNDSSELEEEHHLSVDGVEDSINKNEQKTEDIDIPAYMRRLK